jgi:hypothetical protein
LWTTAFTAFNFTLKYAPEYTFWMFSSSSFFAMFQLSMNMDADTSQKMYSLKYFLLLVFVLSIPFWLLGGTMLPLPVNLPISAMTAFVPTIAASILSFHRMGMEDISDLLRMMWDYKKIKNKGWYFPIFFPGAPALYFVFCLFATDW